MSQGTHSRSHSLLYLFTGLFAGIVIGFGGALLLQDYSFSDMVPFLHDDNDSLNLSEQSSQGRSMAGQKSRQKEMASDDFASAGFEGSTDEWSDSLEAYTSSDTSDVYMAGGPDVVRRDELLSTRKLRVVRTGEASQGKQGGGATDSLLTALTSVKNTDERHQEYILEFWRNPVNYKGYKFMRERIILFGLSPEDTYKLIETDGNLVLQSRQFSFALRETSDFLPLLPRKQNP